jgi:flagellar biosynthesis protein FlhA
MFNNPKAIGITAGIIGMLGMIPGMPNFVFLLMAGGLAWMSWRVCRTNRRHH